MAYVKKVDRPIVEAAVTDAMQLLREPAAAIGMMTASVLGRLDVPDHLFDEVKREVMNQIGEELFRPYNAPPMPGYELGHPPVECGWKQCPVCGTGGGDAP